jgi:hypothetical protein
LEQNQNLLRQNVPVLSAFYAGIAVAAVAVGDLFYYALNGAVADFVLLHY